MRTPESNALVHVTSRSQISYLNAQLLRQALFFFLKRAIYVLGDKSGTSVMSLAMPFKWNISADFTKNKFF